MNLGHESETMEFKKSTAETEEGIISMCAMLNKHGKGMLFFGVKNNGDVAGQDIGETTLNKLSRDISSQIRPAIMYGIEQKNTPDGLNFIEVTFSGDKAPYSAGGRYYLRFHDEDRQMDNDMLRDFYLRQKQDYSDWEKADSGVSVSAVDENLFKNYCERAYEKGRIGTSLSDPQTMLGRLGLLFDDEHLNNAGNVLFSSQKPVRLKLAKFATERRLTILDMEVFEGNTYECIDRAMEYFAAGIDWKAVFDGSVQRKEIPEIPVKAVREIVVNAFSHGEYHSATDFELDIYSNRVTIYSPGIFPKPYTPEDYAEGGYEPIPMNPTITNVLYKDGTIEQMSTGFERAFAECRQTGTAYDYEETAYGFRFTFYRAGKEKTGQLTDNESAVVSCLKDDPDLTIPKLSERLSLSVRTVQRILTKLKDKGMIARTGSNKTGSWIVL